MSQTLEELLHMGTVCLEAAGILDAALDAWYLLSDAFQIDRAHYFLKKKQELNEKALHPGYENYLEMLNLRKQRVPLQQILRSQEFMALPFFVNEHVLIPRQDTETLVELVLRECTDKNVHVLDMCTGSGCIALSLAVWGGYRKVTAVDLSGEALKVAAENVRQLYLNPTYRKKGGCKIEEKQEFCVQEAPLWMCWRTSMPKTEFSLWKSDLFENLTFLEKEQSQSDGTVLENEKLRPNLSILEKGKVQTDGTVLGEGSVQLNLTPLEKVDILVSNPPYIPSDVIAGLEPEVRDHEPRMALDGSADGLYFYRRLVMEAPAHLKPGARVYFEIGYDQGEPLCEILSEGGFEQIRIVKDLAGNDRVAAAVWNAKEYLPDARDGLRRGGDGPH